MIEQYCVSGLEHNNECLTNVVCNGCYFRLLEFSRGNINRRIHIFDHTQIINEPVDVTRGAVTKDHTCLVSEIGSLPFAQGNTLPQLGLLLEIISKTPTPVKRVQA